MMGFLAADKQRRTLGRAKCDELVGMSLTWFRATDAELPPMRSMPVC